MYPTHHLQPGSLSIHGQTVLAQRLESEWDTASKFVCMHACPYVCTCMTVGRNFQVCGPSSYLQSPQVAQNRQKFWFGSFQQQIYGFLLHGHGPRHTFCKGPRLRKINPRIYLPHFLLNYIFLDRDCDSWSWILSWTVQLWFRLSSHSCNSNLETHVSRSFDTMISLIWSRIFF